MHWEYQVAVHVTRPKASRVTVAEELAEILKTRGAMRWELVDVLRSQEEDLITYELFLKRPLD